MLSFVFSKGNKYCFGTGGGKQKVLGGLGRLLWAAGCLQEEIRLQVRKFPSFVPALNIHQRQAAATSYQVVIPVAPATQNQSGK